MTTMTNPTFVQANFRGRVDDTDALNGAFAAPDPNLNANWTQDADTTFRVRFEVEETATANQNNNLAPQLEYNLAGAGWNPVTTSSSVVRAVVSAQFNEGGATTNVLAGSARAFTAGTGSEDGLAATVAAMSNQHTEIEYAIQIRSADVTHGQTLQLRVSNGGAALNTYTQTPTITANVPDATVTPAPIAVTTTLPQATAGGLPQQIAGLGMWYDASQITGHADGAAVSQWDDLSGAARHLAQGTGTNQPTYQTSELNGLPVVRFDGSDDRLATADFGADLTQPLTLFIVLRHTSISAAQNITDGLTFSTTRINTYFATGPDRWAMYAGGAGEIAGGTPDTNPHLLTCAYDGASSVFRIDGAQVATGNPGANTWDGFMLGSDPTPGVSNLHADVAEIIVYDAALSSGDRDALEAYLTEKWLATGDANVTPAPVAAVAAFPQPGVGIGTAPAVMATSAVLPAAQTNIGATAAPIAAISALSQPAVSVGVTKAPVTAAGSFPQPGVGVGAAPAVIAATSALLQAAVGIGVTKVPVAVVAALPQTAVGVGVVPTPAALTVSLPLPSSIGQGGGGSATVEPATLAAIASLPQPGVGVGAAPAVIAALASLPQALISVGVTPAVIAVTVDMSIYDEVFHERFGASADIGVGVAPASLASTIALPLPPSVGQDGGGGVTRTPDPVAAVASLPQPGIGVGVTKAPFALTTSLLQPGIGVGVTKAPFALTTSLPQPGVGVGVAPTPLASTITLLLPASVGQDGGGDATRTPDPVAAIASFPQPGAGVGVTKAPFALTTSLPLAIIAVHATPQPASAALIIGLPQPGVSVGVIPATIALLTAIWLPERVGPPFEDNINPAGPVIVGVITVDPDAVPGVTVHRGGMVGGIG